MLRGSYYLVSSEEDLEALEGCTAVVGNLAIRCATCFDLRPLSQLTSVSEALYLYCNGRLTSLHGLENLASVGSLAIGRDYCRSDCDWCDNPLLTDLHGLESLTEVKEVLLFSRTAYLDSLDGLDSLASVGHLELERTFMTSLGGAGNLTSVGDLDIQGNPLLPDCEICALREQLESPPLPVHEVIAGNLADTCTPAPANCPD